METPPSPPPIVEVSAPPPVNRRPQVVIYGLILLLAAVAVGYFFAKTGPKACTMEAKVCPDGSTVGRTGPNCEFSACLTIIKKIPTATIIPKPSGVAEKSNSNLKTFTSQALGTTFTYLEKQGEETIGVKEMENKIYVYTSLTKDPTTGQSLEMFKKDKGDTLAQAIQKQFLVVKPEKECFVESYTLSNNYPGSYVGAAIAYPTSSQDDLSTMEEKASKCSPKYAKSNGLSYFLMDANHPDKFYFLSIGQYAISSEKMPWQDTLIIN